MSQAGSGGRAAAERQPPPSGLTGARERARQPRGNASRRHLYSLGGEELAHELAEHHRLPVGDEVGIPRPSPRGAKHESLDGVLDVGGRGAVAPSADPREAPALDHPHHRRKQRRIADAPREAGTDDHRLEAVPVRGQHQLLGARLGGAVQRRRVRAQRCCLVDAHQRLAGEQRRLGTHVHKAPHAGLGARAQGIARALHVAAAEVLGLAPIAERRRGVERELAPLGVKELEPLATALFLKREQPDANDETLAARLHTIKPHVSVDAARVALQKVGGWMAERA